MTLFLAIIFAVGGVVCHQLPERSFFLDGQQLPVCARCTGLYASGAVGLLGFWILKAGRGWPPMTLQPGVVLRLLAVAAVPTALSVATAWIGAWDGSNVTRALLAIPLGATAGTIVAAVATKDLR
jgi:uncharacterized membrane protein